MHAGQQHAEIGLAHVQLVLHGLARHADLLVAHRFAVFDAAFDEVLMDAVGVVERQAVRAARQRCDRRACVPCGVQLVAERRVQAGRHERTLESRMEQAAGAGGIVRRSGGSGAWVAGVPRRQVA
ncbi:hypothetical protein G3N64_05720 [Burkholderia sp. Ac-20344]|nr:hypothetical protein [Burkholderia sp. Ac-20344]MBN3831369.1 hypothetical protein [Burkholderia sp. Ac-20344]